MRKVFQLAGRLENVWVITALMLLWTLGFSVFQQSLALFIEEVWIHIPSDELARAQAGGHEALTALKNVYYQRAAGLTAIVMVATGITAAIVQGGLIGKLAQRFGERRLLRIGMPLIGIGITMVIFVAKAEYFPGMIPCAVIMAIGTRSEEHTSELQSRGHLVCRLLLEKKNESYKATAGYRDYAPHAYSSSNGW